MKMSRGIDVDGEAGQPTDRKSALAGALRHRIISMELRPGAVVDELELADEFSLSRPPVRELMRQMAAEGYIELEANRPARVSSLNYQSLRSFFLAAPLIYIVTTQLAAANSTPDDIDRLKRIQQNLQIAVSENDVDGRVRYNDQFHLEIGRMAQNDYLMPSLRRLLIDHARLGKIFYRHPGVERMQQDMADAVDQHEQIIKAIALHDAVRAGDLIRAHWELSRLRMAEYAVPEGVHVPIGVA
ncbi:GntR family transcriptional regulator [Paraburkholderia oxyphila]|uniref:GntR family transcriptional regulator n=1 Tax=Paraburkholderia oxyphila TaxID=614212 RepID=UPI0005B8CBA7|nr:GntR family transcriptional regulator [Paraburkholderia oxyphila]